MNEETAPPAEPAGGLRLLADLELAAEAVVAPTPLGKLAAVLAIVRAHPAAFAVAATALLVLVAGVLAVHLPAPQLRVYAVAVLAIACLLAGFFAPHPPEPPRTP